MRGTIPGVLLIYNHAFEANAPTILEHVAAFGRSRHPVWSINTDLGFPASLDGLRFEVVVFHYSAFYALPTAFVDYICSHRPGTTVAFFQDEHHNWPARRAFIERLQIDTVYSLLEPAEAARVYGRFQSVKRIHQTLTGYVGASLLQAAADFARPPADRRIDIGYRARKLPAYMGIGAQEKHLIAEGFLARAKGLDLALDIDSTGQRIYGASWYQFVGDCRAMLGVEAGVSIFDFDDTVRRECEQLERDEPGIAFDELSRRVLAKHEGNVYYRTVSPRHFEAAAFRTCQILFEGSYQQILIAHRHYIPLRKDFSNFDEVIATFRDPDARARITNCAHDELIQSRKYSDEAFVAQFDREIESTTPALGVTRQEYDRIERQLRRGERLRRMRARVEAAYRSATPVRRVVERVGGRVLRRRRQDRNPFGAV